APPEKDDDGEETTAVASTRPRFGWFRVGVCSGVDLAADGGAVALPGAGGGPVASHCVVWSPPTSDAGSLLALPHPLGGGFEATNLVFWVAQLVFVMDFIGGCCGIGLSRCRTRGVLAPDASVTDFSTPATTENSNNIEHASGELEHGNGEIGDPHGFPRSSEIGQQIQAPAKSKPQANSKDFQALGNFEAQTLIRSPNPSHEPSGIIQATNHRLGGKELISPKKEHGYSRERKSESQS
ncbi:hypothetical protein Dimus_016302, partial [Dionaea muscipula]